MDFGLILPSYRAGASTESIDAASAAAARLGWHSVFTTDHLLVEPSKRSEDYYTLYDALNTLAYLAAKQPTLKLGASVVVVPMRNAVELAKELSTIDSLSGGRLIVGVGVGWNETEFQHLGYGERFSQRGAYLTEAVDDMAAAVERRHGTVRRSLPLVGRSALRAAAGAGRECANLVWRP